MNSSEIALLIEKAHRAKTDNNYWTQISKLRKFVNEGMISNCFLLIDSDDLKSKQIGIDILSQLGRDRKSFIHKMFDKIFYFFETSNNENLIFTSLFAIGHNNEYLKIKHLKILEKFKKSKSKDVRYALTFSLLGVEKKIAIDMLIELAQDKSSRIRDWATFGLGTQIKADSETIRNILYKNSLSKDNQIRQEAIKGLANRDDERVDDIILSELRHKNLNPIIFDTLLNIKNGKQYLPTLVKIYKKSKNDIYINKEWLSGLINCIEILEED